MGRALAQIGVQVTSDPKAGNLAEANPDGSLRLNYTPFGEEMWDNATLNEELWHLVGLMTLRAEWEAAGRPGNFNQFEDARMAEMFDELATRIRSLEGDERAKTEQALVDSFNLYFSPFEKGELKAQPWRMSKMLSARRPLLRLGSMPTRSSLNCPPASSASRGRQH